MLELRIILFSLSNYSLLYIISGAPQQICGRNLIGSSFATSQGYLILRFRSGLTNTASRGFDATISAFRQGKIS